jgi:hypothetical protein
VEATLTEPAGRPPVLKLGLELPRTVAAGALFAASEWLLHRADTGDGHPVLILPGFLVDDRATLALRWHLRRCGYEPHGWNLGLNVGPTKEIIDGIRRTLGELATEHDRAVSLIGWSLGGVYARELARIAPDEVRQVITLASPYRLTDLHQTRACRLYTHYSGRHDERYRIPPYRCDTGPLPVPSTAIYSRDDGIVPWRTCVQPVGPITENIEVHGSHCGLGHNAAAVYAVGDRLAQPEHHWQPFDPPGVLRYLYPPPVDG